MTTAACKTCETITERIYLFPGGVCLDCFKQTKRAQTPVTSDALARMWGAR